MAAGEIENTATTEAPAGTSSDLPSFVELLSRNAFGLAERASHPVEERRTLESGQIVARETGTTAWIEIHGKRL